MIGGIVDLTELQHAIEELQGIKRVKPRTASLDDAQKLLEEGYDIKWISRSRRRYSCSFKRISSNRWRRTNN
jgi:hypothetical protein